MSGSYSITAESIIEIAAHYEAKEERWIHVAKDSKVRLSGRHVRIATIPIRCKTLIRAADGTVREGESVRLRLEINKQMICCPVQAEQEAIDSRSVKHVNLAFSEVNEPDNINLFHCPEAKRDLITRNNEFIVALELIAAEIERLYDDICNNPHATVPNSMACDLVTENCVRHSFAQPASDPGGKAIYRVSMPVAARSGLVALQLGFSSMKPAPIIFTMIRARDGKQKKRELRHTKDPPRELMRYDSLTYRTVSEMVPQQTIVWGIAQFRELELAERGIRTVVTCTGLAAMHPWASRGYHLQLEEIDENIAMGVAASSKQRHRAEGEVERG